jgi:guanylate kinase
MIVVLSGPSGVGKDTVLDAWIAADPRVVRVVTYTTRPPRHGEVDGVDYNFVDLETFMFLNEQGHFWEHKVVHGNYYASPKKDTLDLMADGKIPVLKIDVQGALEVMPLLTGELSVFILPPSMEELERRIRGRATDDEETIQKRLRNAWDEIALADRYQMQVVNDDVTAVVKRLMEATGGGDER